MRIRDPKTTALIFASGKVRAICRCISVFSTSAGNLSLVTLTNSYVGWNIAGQMVCTGAKHEEQCRQAARKYTYAYAVQIQPIG